MARCYSTELYRAGSDSFGRQTSEDFLQLAKISRNSLIKQSLKCFVFLRIRVLLVYVSLVLKLSHKSFAFYIVFLFGSLSPQGEDKEEKQADRTIRSFPSWIIVLAFPCFFLLSTPSLPASPPGLLSFPHSPPLSLSPFSRPTYYNFIYSKVCLFVLC